LVKRLLQSGLISAHIHASFTGNLGRLIAMLSTLFMLGFPHPCLFTLLERFASTAWVLPHMKFLAPTCSLKLSFVHKSSDGENFLNCVLSLVLLTIKNDFHGQFKTPHYAIDDKHRALIASNILWFLEKHF